MVEEEYDDGDDVGDSEDPEPSDVHGDASIDTRPCPHCGEAVHDQAELWPALPKLYFGRGGADPPSDVDRAKHDRDSIRDFLPMV